MNEENLFEMATLDALGLLDAEERRVFEEAFEGASPALKEELRREQRRLTDLERTLPNVEPPASLRDRVLFAVREAMSAMAPARASGVIARIGSNEWSIRRAVSPLWRAACIGFATATIVLIAVGFYMRDTFDAALQDFRDRDLTQMMIQDLGRDFTDRLLHPASLKVSFQPTDESARARAAILIDPESRTAYLVTSDLPEIEGEYTLVIVNDAGEIDRPITKFAHSGKLSGTPITSEIELGAPLAIVPPTARSEKATPLLMSL
jgi:hypothetical protein